MSSPPYPRRAPLPAGCALALLALAAACSSAQSPGEPAQDPLVRACVIVSSWQNGSSPACNRCTVARCEPQAREALARSLGNPQAMSTQSCPSSPQERCACISERFTQPELRRSRLGLDTCVIEACEPGCR